MRVIQKGKAHLMNSSVLQHILNMKQATLGHGHVWLSGTGLLLFIDDVTADRNSRINYEAICSLLSLSQRESLMAQSLLQNEYFLRERTAIFFNGHLNHLITV